MGIMDLLVKAGLLEYSAQEIEAMSPEMRAKTFGTAMPIGEVYAGIGSDVVVPSASEKNVSAGAPLKISSLSEIYNQAQVPDSPFPYERFVELLDQLSYLDDTGKKIVIAQMDAEDASWTVSDIESDLVAKQKALIEYKKALVTKVEDAKSLAIIKMNTAKEENAKRVLAMRLQIRELESQIAELESGIQMESRTIKEALREAHPQGLDGLAESFEEIEILDELIVSMAAFKLKYFN